MRREWVQMQSFFSRVEVHSFTVSNTRIVFFHLQIMVFYQCSIGMFGPFSTVYKLHQF
jgi:hypothetical protein